VFITMILGGNPWTSGESEYVHDTIIISDYKSIFGK